MSDRPKPPELSCVKGECFHFEEGDCLPALRDEVDRLQKGIGTLALELDRRGQPALAGALLLWRDGLIGTLTFKEDDGPR